jgi:hypothetical protein
MVTQAYIFVNFAMTKTDRFKQSIYIEAPVEVVDRTITDRELMHRWLNPALRCDPVGPWSCALGSQTRFVIQIPLLQPTLHSTVVERQEGLVVWAFDGYFKGRDCWQCTPESSGTRLVNCFEFKINNPLIAFGFHTFAAPWTQRDMQAQLQRLKHIAESLSP